MPKGAPPAAMLAATQSTAAFVPKIRGTPLKSSDSEDEKSDDSYEAGRNKSSARDREGGYTYKKSLDASSDFSPSVDEDSYYEDQRKEKGHL